MSENVEIVIEAPAWENVGLTALIDRAAPATLQYLRLPADCGVAVLATDDARIRVLNAQHRSKDGATNVLSWPSEDLSGDAPGHAPRSPEADFPGEAPFLGDIALAYETCVREAEAGGKPLEDHVNHLIIHGLLHLLGYDHVHDRDAALMERLEAEILGELGLPDPY